MSNTGSVATDVSGIFIGAPLRLIRFARRLIGSLIFFLGDDCTGVGTFGEGLTVEVGTVIFFGTTGVLMFTRRRCSFSLVLL